MKRFKADLTFDDNKRKELSPAFLWYLFQRYIIYKRTGLREPAKVTEHVRRYRERHDPYLLYVKEKLEKLEEGEAHLTIGSLFTDYTTWFKLTFGDPHAKIKRPDFQANISKKIGNPLVKGNVTFWNNYRLRDIAQEEEAVFKSAGEPGSGSKGSSGAAIVTAQSSRKTAKSSRNASKASSSEHEVPKVAKPTKTTSKASSSDHDESSGSMKLRPRKK